MPGTVTGPIQNLIFLIVRLAPDLAMIILLIRYLAGPYLYIDTGPFLQAINQAAMTMSRPFRWVTRWIPYFKKDASPLAAIFVILVFRGLLVALVPASFNTVKPTATIMLLGQQISFAMGALGLLRLMGLALFFSVMFARAGGLYSGVFFRIIDDLAARIFGQVRMVFHIRNLWALLSLGIVYLSLLYGIVICLLAWDIRFPFFWGYGIVSVLSSILWVVFILCIIYIIISWTSMFSQPDESNRAWLFLQVTVSPMFHWIRRLVPWARIGVLELSPIFLFFGLYLLMAIVEMAGQALLMQVPPSTYQMVTYQVF